MWVVQLGADRAAPLLTADVGGDCVGGIGGVEVVLRVAVGEDQRQRRHVLVGQGEAVALGVLAGPVLHLRATAREANDRLHGGVRIGRLTAAGAAVIRPGDLDPHRPDPGRDLEREVLGRQVLEVLDSCARTSRRAFFSSAPTLPSPILIQESAPAQVPPSGCVIARLPGESWPLLTRQISSGSDFGVVFIDAVSLGQIVVSISCTRYLARSSRNRVRRIPVVPDPERLEPLDVPPFASPDGAQIGFLSGLASPGAAQQQSRGGDRHSAHHAGRPTTSVSRRAT